MAVNVGEGRSIFPGGADSVPLALLVTLFSAMEGRSMKALSSCRRRKEYRDPAQGRPYEKRRRCYTGEG